MRTLKRIISLLLCAALLLPGAAGVLRARAVQVYTLQPGVFTEVTIETLGETVYYSFTPEADGRYRLYSVADRDVEAELFNGNMEYICYNDDGGEDQNFCLEYDFSAGQTYYFAVFFHQDGVGSFQIRLVELTGSGVQASSKTGRTNYMVPVGGGLTLGVDASSDMGDVTLRWYRKTVDGLTLVEGETADTFTVEGLAEGDWFWVCRAADAFGSHVDVTFFIVCATPQVLTANSTATVTVETVNSIKYLAFTPEVTGTYRLYSVAEKDVTADLYDAQMNRIGHDDDGGDGRNFCLDHALTAGETYYYAVSFYHADTGSFTVNLLHLTAQGLSAKAKDDKTMFLVPFGGSVTLTVEASSGLGPVAYRWYRYIGEDYVLLEGENAASLTLSDLTYGGQWLCRVTDDHGSCSDISFYVDCATPQPLTLDTAFTVTVETAGQTVYFSFTPEVTANYCFYSAADRDVTAELYDADMRHIGHDDDSGEDQNFVLNHTLEAGETYYYSARYYHGDTGSFTVYLIRPAENGFSADRVSQEFAFIHPGDSVTMEVTAACDDGVLHYHWRSQTEDKNIEGANGPSFTSPPAERGEVYLCIVTDNHGNRAEIRFELVNLDAITYTWAEDFTTCTATYTDCSPTLIETAGVESYCTATCTEDGFTVYTAAFTNPRFSAQEKKEETPHFGHAYGEPVYVWNEDLSECTAMVVCANDESHVIGETAKTNYEVTLKPTCTEPGVGVYTAAFNNKRFYGQVKEVEIPASGHAYGEPVYVWSEDYGECTAMVICANDETHVISETAKSEAEIKPATCTEPGLAVYTVGFVNKRFFSQVKEVELPASGHAWGEPVYVWSDDLSECTATVICANDESHVISETAKTQYEVTLKPTCTEPGVGVYTAAFSDRRFYVQQKEVEIPAAGHDYGEPVYVWSEDLSECTAMVICANDETHVISETAKSEVEIKPATCTEPGLAVYTVGFNNKRFWGQRKEVEIPAAGHNYGEPVYVWSEDLSECTATVICANDASHEISETAKSNCEIKVKPTCTEPGVAVYTVCFSSRRFYQQTKKAELPALGHDLVPHEAQTPTCTDVGWEAYETCSRCDHTTFAQLPAAGHTPGEPQRENETDTAYDEVVYCTVCGAELSRNTVSLAVFLPGDADADGQITASDARLALRRAVDLETFAEGSKEFIACDIDKDGSVTAGDARIILRIAVALESVEDYE